MSRCPCHPGHAASSQAPPAQARPPCSACWRGSRHPPKVPSVWTMPTSRRSHPNVAASDGLPRTQAFSRASTPWPRLIWHSARRTSPRANDATSLVAPWNPLGSPNVLATHPINCPRAKPCALRSRGPPLHRPVACSWTSPWPASIPRNAPACANGWPAGRRRPAAPSSRPHIGSTNRSKTRRMSSCSVAAASCSSPRPTTSGGLPPPHGSPTSCPRSPCGGASRPTRPKTDGTAPCPPAPPPAASWVFGWNVPHGTQRLPTFPVWDPCAWFASKTLASFRAWRRCSRAVNFAGCHGGTWNLLRLRATWDGHGSARTPWWWRGWMTGVECLDSS